MAKFDGVDPLDDYGPPTTAFLYRHSGGLSANGVLPLTASYVTFNAGDGPGLPLVFKDDRAAAEIPPRSIPGYGGFLSRSIQVINDSATSIFISFDGVWDHFEIKAGEGRIADHHSARKIWLRGQVGGEAYRLSVW